MSAVFARARHAGSRFRAVGFVAIATTLCACPAPRRVSGVVHAGDWVRTTTTGHAFGAPLSGATVTWSCPPGAQGPKPQTLTTDYDGKFSSKDFYQDMPGECELTISAPGYETFHERFDAVCDPSTGGLRSCRVAVELRKTPAAPAASGSIAVTLPRALSSDATPAPTMNVHLGPGGAVTLDGVAVTGDEAIMEAARSARAKTATLRAVVDADASAPYSSVIHLMDLLRRAGITDIAFGVAPPAPIPMPSSAPGPVPTPKPNTNPTAPRTQPLATTPPF